MTDTIASLTGQYCNKCLYWDGMNGDVGDCRRRSPVMVLDGTWPRATWPISKSHDWCGEWRGSVDTEGMTGESDD